MTQRLDLNGLIMVKSYDTESDRNGLIMAKSYDTEIRPKQTHYGNIL